MKPIHQLSMSIAALTLSITAGAQGLTREEVRAEWQAAHRSGDLIAMGELGLTERELRPGSYPAVVQPTRARSQVREELAQAMRAGDVPSGDVDIVRSGNRPHAQPGALTSVRAHAGSLD